MKSTPSTGVVPVLCLLLLGNLLPGCVSPADDIYRGLANPQGPSDPPRVFDAVDTSQPVLDAGWQRETGDLRVRAAGAVGFSTFDASASEIDPRSGDYFGAAANFRTELLYAPCPNFEIGPRFLIGGRGYEFEDDDRLEFGAFDLFGELVARAYFGEVDRRALRPYFEVFAGGGLQSGEVEFIERRGFSQIVSSTRETGGVFTFGGGTGVEWLTDEDVTGTLGIEVRSVQAFDAPFLDPDLQQLDVSLVFGVGYSF